MSAKTKARTKREGKTDVHYLHLCKDGTVSIRKHGEQVFNGIALPVLECASLEEARSVQVATCKLQRTAHPDMKEGDPWYKLASGPFPFGFSGEYEDIETVERYLEWVLASVRLRAAAR